MQKLQKLALIEITDEQTARFALFYNLLTEKNSLYNLTAITEKDEVIEKHFLDSLAGVSLISGRVPKPPHQSCGSNKLKIIDVGAGAGFPSIPLAIIKPELEITMLESVLKKVNFLNEAIAILNLENARAVHSRAEDFAKLTAEREQYNFVIARAVAKLPTLLELCAPFAKIGGQIVLWKGPSYKEELAAAKNATEKLGLKFERAESYTLPESCATHCLLVFKKVSKTPLMYPRGQNKPRTNPL